MVDGDAGERRDHRIGDGGCVEGVGVSDWEEQAGYARQGRDMRGADGLDRDVSVGGWVARRDGVGIGFRVEGWVCICLSFGVGGLVNGGLGGD